MAYSVNDPLIMMTTAALAVGPRLWYHESADNGAAAQLDGFITNGVARGLNPGDIVWHKDTGTNIVTSHLVFASTSAPGVAVDLGNATVVVSGTNAD
jgi:hypothetical protein